MLKLAQSTPKKLQQVTERGVRAPSVVQSLGNHVKARKEMYDIQGKHVGRLGILYLNKEHRFNTLSPSFAHEVSRGIGSYYQDRQLKAMYVSSRQGKHWSNGTDFRTLHHMKKEGSYEALRDYIEQLYQLQTQVAKTNKPIVAVAPGHAFNSGATLLASCGYPLMTIDSKMAFNECTFGFVPHSGASYYLSRLPNDFGTFLALTGLPIHGTDAAQLKLVDGILQSNKFVEDQVADVIYSQGYDPREFHNVETNHGEKLKDNKRSNLRIETIKMRNQKISELNSNPWGKAEVDSMLDREERPYHRFEEGHERIPSSVGLAEGFYRSKLRRESLKHESEAVGYLDWGGPLSQRDDWDYQEWFGPCLQDIKSIVGHQYQADHTVAFQHMEMIGRCFYSNSIEEIMQNLREENHPFATKCLEAMQRNSDLSMRLALKMLRQAQNTDYANCLRMEVKVASKMIETKEFDIGVEQVLMSPKARKGQKHPNAAKYPKKLSMSSDLDSYFEGANWAKDISVGAMAHALLPTRHFYTRFGDHVRLWINEESTHQDEIRSSFDIEAKEALQEQGIDVRDRGLTMQSAREHLAGKLGQERREAVQAERAKQLMTDEKLKQKYFLEIAQEVQKLRDMSKEKQQSKIDQCIQTVFEQAYIQRLQKMFDKSKEAQSLERRRMFIRLKRFLFRSRCLSQGAEDHQKQIQRMENYSYRLPHLTESWEKSWRDTEHPLIQKSPLYHISKAIGRVSFSPMELTKEYLTKPEMRDQLSMLTVDKNELLKLQEDLYNNPQKWTEILTKRERIDWGQERHFWAQHRREDHDVRFEDYQYWQTMASSDGAPDALENWPYYREYMAYKTWYEQIEDKALHTLKLAVAQLLADFDEDNPVYEGKSKSKRGQLQELISLVEGTDSEMNASAKEKVKATKKERKSSKSTTKQRDLNQIDKLLDAAVCEDPHLKHVLDPTLGENHPMIAKIQAKARKELLKMLEIVLLDKYHDSGDQEELDTIKQRLESLMTPRGMSSEDIRHQQLSLIDSYLLKETGKDTLKSAIEIVRPMYLNYINAMLAESGQALAEKLQFNQTRQQVLLYHYIQREYPGMLRSETLQKLFNYSNKRYNAQLYYRQQPDDTPSFKRRQLMNNFGQLDDPKYLQETPIEEQKALNLRQVKDQKEILQKLAANIEANEQEWKEENKEMNDKILHPDHKKGDDMRENELFWSNRESAELKLWQILEEQSKQWLMDHLYEIDNHMTIFDWMKIYSEAYFEYGIDMNQQMKAAQGEGVDAEQRDPDEWHNMLEVARYLAGFKDAFRKLGKEQLNLYPKMAEFLSKLSNVPDNATHASIWQQALVKKNQYFEEQKRASQTDRNQIIRAQLADFNTMKDMSLERDKLVQKIERMAESQPVRVQDLIREALNQPKTYIDFEKLSESLSMGEDLTTSDVLSKLINVDQLIGDMKTQQAPQNLRDRIFERTIDVQSIEDAKVEAESDSSLSRVEKAQIRSLIDHVSEQMEFVSNSRRQTLKFGQFLSDYHFSSANAYADYASTLLQQKLQKVLGEPMQKQEKVDWELDGVRTSPVDHNQNDDKQPSEYLSSVSDGSETVQQVDEQVNFTDPMTGLGDTKSLRDHVQIGVLREAKNLTALQNDMEQYRNFYENKLLTAMMSPGNTEEAEQQIIDEYMNMRFKTCMLNSNFAEKVRNSDNGHLYLKVLRERVVDELGLTEKPDIEKMKSKAILESSEDYIKYDLDSMYNMQDVNNLHAIGYDNLNKRSGAADNVETYENSHENVFDKLLADYYLSSRADYAESNKLMRQLANVFETKMKQGVQNNFTRDLKHYKLNQDLDKYDAPMIKSAKHVLDLDLLTHNAIEKGKSGLSDDLSQISITDTEHKDFWTTQVPEYFDYFDVRKPANKVVQDELQQIISEAFETRRKLEKNMSRRELIAFDKVLSKYLQPSNVLAKLEASIAENYSMINQGRQKFELEENLQSTREDDFMKEPHRQRYYNKSIKNEDAMYKQLAYGVMVEQKYKKQWENPDNETFKDKEYYVSNLTFERYYMRELEREAKLKPRPINPDDYKPKKFMLSRKDKMPEWMDEKARRKNFMEDYALVKENKKEQYDRTALFYILEQFYEHTRENPDKTSKAHEHMKEYFSDPDNTFFFDKNKIQ